MENNIWETDIDRRIILKLIFEKQTADCSHLLTLVPRSRIFSFTLKV
jgi:hypothetical protein